jgi:PLP dependent protein
MSVRENLSAILQQLPASCKLIAVTKTQPIGKILEAYESGHRIFGENKVQELMSKCPDLPDDIEWHLIGHLQTNKVKYIAPFISLIHSVDSLKLLQEIDKQAAKVNRVISCLLQVHIAKEESKFGFSESELEDLFAAPSLATMKNVKVIGLMGMATFTENNDVVRNEFAYLKSIFERLKKEPRPRIIEMSELSMGMSGDYKIAVEEGSTMVRIGTAIFGERNR